MDRPRLGDTMPDCPRERCPTCARIPTSISIDYFAGESDPPWLSDLVDYGAGRGLEQLNACTRCGRLYVYTLVQQYTDGIHCEQTGIRIDRVVGGEVDARWEKWAHDEKWRERQKHSRLPSLPRIAKAAAPDHDEETTPEERERIAAAQKKAESDQREWSALIREVVEKGPAKLWDLELVRSALSLANAPEHAAWARPFLERMIFASDDPEIVGVCTEAVIAWTGKTNQDDWAAIGSESKPRFGKAGEEIGRPYWLREPPPCPACASKQTSLIFCRYTDYHDPFYDYSNAAIEVECAACGSFSVLLRHSESRS